MANNDTLIDASQLLPVTGQPTGSTPAAAPIRFEDLSAFLPPKGKQASTSAKQDSGSGLPVYSSLAQARSRFADELQNPDIRRLLMASIDAEVGDQKGPALHAYTESVMNRAIATNRSLVDTIIDPYDPRTKKGYYPPSTINKLGAKISQSQADQYNPIIDSVLSGSNISNLATGNESGSLRSMPVTFDPGSGERFVAESNTRDWRKAQLDQLTQATQPAQIPQGVQIAQASTSGSSPTWQDLSQYLTRQ
jgi:hypothetical protein